mmetsp:Transcript_16739/g.38515  ORF Transcript_16739/g.38515 Transcript_16739/m.38515 type:complete len:293 (+) Transcript_16739:717-1595(+)
MQQLTHEGVGRLNIFLLHIISTNHNMGQIVTLVENFQRHVQVQAHSQTRIVNRGAGIVPRQKGCKMLSFPIAHGFLHLRVRVTPRIHFSIPKGFDPGLILLGIAGLRNIRRGIVSNGVRIDLDPRRALQTRRFGYALTVPGEERSGGAFPSTATNGRYHKKKRIKKASTITAMNCLDRRVPKSLRKIFCTKGGGLFLVLAAVAAAVLFLQRYLGGLGSTTRLDRGHDQVGQFGTFVVGFVVFILAQTGIDVQLQDFCNLCWHCPASFVFELYFGPVVVHGGVYQRYDDELTL